MEGVTLSMGTHSEPHTPPVWSGCNPQCFTFWLLMEVHSWLVSLIRIYPLCKLLVWVTMVENNIKCNIIWWKNVSPTNLVDCWACVPPSYMMGTLWRRGPAFIVLKETFPWCLMPTGCGETLRQRWNCCRVWNNCSKLTWCEEISQLLLHPSRPHSSPAWTMTVAAPSDPFSLLSKFRDRCCWIDPTNVWRSMQQGRTGVSDFSPGQSLHSLNSQQATYTVSVYMKYIYFFLITIFYFF